MSHQRAGPNIKPGADGWPQLLLTLCHKHVAHNRECVYLSARTQNGGHLVDFSHEFCFFISAQVHFFVQRFA